MKRILCAILALLLLLGLMPAMARAREAVPEISDLPQASTVVRVNPLYAGFIRESDLNQPGPVAAAYSHTYHTSAADAAADIREQMKNRAETVSVTLVSDQEWVVPVNELVEAAFAHTGVPTEGDYLRSQYAGYVARTSSYSDGGAYYQTISYTFTYFTTAEQERQLDEAVSALLEQLNLGQADDYTTVKTIYDWICANITYDHVNLGDYDYKLQYSAYAALINRTAVCNGYAVLLYRLLLEEGVDVRFISGDGNGEFHAWNIVRLDGRYYLCDSTWDAGKSHYLYFLKSPANVADHVNGAAYSTDAFRAAYPAAEENYIPGAGTAGEPMTWSLSGEGTLTISGTGDMPDVTPESQPWLACRADIRKVVIQNGVTGIGDNAFYGCTALESVTFPGSLTFVGNYAFYGCTGLGGAAIPAGVTAIGDFAFYGCETLANITLSRELKSIGSFTFSGCRSLRSPVFPETLTSIGAYAFHDCGAITSVTISESVTGIPNAAFCGCTGLTGIRIPDSVTDIGNYAFYGCTGLKSVTLPKNIPYIRSLAFCFCESLTNVAIPEKVTVIEQFAFYGCGGLTNVTIPNGVAEIGNSAFFGCESLAGIRLPDSLTRLGAFAFYGCGSLKDVTIPKGVTEISSGAFAMCESLTGVSFLGNVTAFGTSAFHGCKKLSDISVPSSLVSLGEYAFCGCESLSTLTVPSGVSHIPNYVFWGCTNLKSVYFAGDAPTFSPDSFLYAAATVYYPSKNTTWTRSVLQNYGGTVTWKPYKPSCTHPSVTVRNACDPTCTADGYTGDTVCGSCGETVETGKVINAPGHSWEEGFVNGEAAFFCTVCGKPRTGNQEVCRIYGSNRFDTAFQVADAMKANLGTGKFDAIIIASGTGFADALSGSYLASVKNAPILLSFDEAYNRQAKAYIRENLNPGGTVYILGGCSAVPSSMETGLDGFRIFRLAGADRFETNLMILREAGAGDKPILICTGIHFADSLSASACRLPILLVHETLTEDQKSYLENLDGNPFYVIGGESAVSGSLLAEAAEYGEVRRLGGGNRFETSVLIAETFFEDPRSAVLAYAWNYPDGLCGGALASTMDAPLLLTMTGFEAAAAAYVQNAGITKGTVLGGPSLISDNAVRNIFDAA